MVGPNHAVSRHCQEFAIPGKRSNEATKVSTLLPSRTFWVRSCGAELDSLSEERQRLVPATTSQNLIRGATILVDAVSLCEECTMLGDPSQQRMSPIRLGSKPRFQAMELGTA